MKIISYNVNGIRAALKKGLGLWIQKENPDIICVQEIKVDSENAPFEVFEKLGYFQSWFHAEKKGYSGVATFSKIKPSEIQKGIGYEKYDAEGRVLKTVINSIDIYNCYFPSGSGGEERQALKMDFLSDFTPYINVEINKGNSVIVLGDYNIVHNEIDIHNPKRKDNPSGYRPEERAYLEKLFSTNFTDAFRYLNPEKQEFSWWSYRAGAKPNNKGWRIDYIAVSALLKNKLVRSRHYTDCLYSDHCPVSIEIEL